MGGVIALAALRLVAWGWYLQPEPLRGFWAWALGLLLRAFDLRAKIVRGNLELAYPGEALAAERERLFKASYGHLARLSLEIVMLFGPMRRFATRRSVMHGVDHWRAAKAKGKGVIFLASHVGNWEVMAATGASQHEIDIKMVTKHLKPEWLHRAVEHGRARCGVRAAYEPRTLRDVLAHLRDNGTVGFVLDQYAGPPIGVRVPVFGVPVGTTTAIAALARRTGAAVLPVVNHRTPEGRFETQILAPLEWIADPDATREVAVNTALYASRLEEHIRRYPEQWLWIHRRFKGDLSPLKPGEWDQARVRQ